MTDERITDESGARAPGRGVMRGVLAGGVLVAVGLAGVVLYDQLRAPPEGADEVAADAGAGLPDVAVPVAGEAGAEAAGAPAALPRFDLVRVDPQTGMVTVAGMAAPQALVTVLVDADAAAEVRADASGAFAVLFVLEASAEARAVTLEMQAPGAVVLASEQSLLIAPVVQAPEGDGGGGGRAPAAAAPGDAEAAAAVVEAVQDGLAAAPVAEQPLSAGAAPEVPADAPPAMEAVAVEEETAPGGEQEGVAGDAAGAEVTAEEIAAAPAAELPEPPAGPAGAGDVEPRVAAPEAAEPAGAAPDASLPGAAAPEIAAAEAAGTAALPPGEPELVSVAPELQPELAPDPLPEVTAAGAAGDAGAPSAAPAAPAGRPAAVLVDSAGVRVVQPPGGPVAAGRPEVMDNVVIDAISYSAEGTVQLAGRATGDGAVRLYVDNRLLETVAIGAGGGWSGALPEIDTGVYTLRVDELDASGTVVSRFETPFRREDPELLAALAEVPARGARAQLVTVQPGATLWGISRERYGEGMLYVQVFEANRDLIRNPNLIYPGQVFALPEIPGTAPTP